MVKKLAISITKRWINSDIIDKTLYSACVYGLETIMLAIIGIINIILIGLFTKTFGNSLAFLCTFIFLREFTGGFHADSCLGCNICMALIYLSNQAAIFMLNQKSVVWSYIISIMAGFITILLIAPVEGPQKRLDSIKKKRNKIKAILLYVIFWFFGLLLFFIYPVTSLTINFTLIEIIILMVIGNIIKNKKYIYKEELI